MMGGLWRKTEPIIAFLRIIGSASVYVRKPANSFLLDFRIRVMVI